MVLKCQNLAQVVEAANAPSQDNRAVETLIRQLQEQKSMLQDDNLRLQSKIQRLNKAAPAVQAAQVPVLLFTPKSL
jgi:hypothetical protein